MERVENRIYASQSRAQRNSIQNITETIQEITEMPSTSGNSVETANLAPTRRMPKPGEKNAPSFDAERPEELARFFERIEEWYAEEHITNDTEKKKRIVRYLDPDSEAQWKALSKFSEGTYLDFKTQVMASYPKAEEILKGSMVTLKRKIKAFGHVDLEERHELHNLVRTMTAEIAKLKEITPPIHTNRELVELFLARLSPEFASRIAQKLSMHRQWIGLNPQQNQNVRNSEDLFDVTEVMEFAKQTAEEMRNPYAKFAINSGGSNQSHTKLEEAVARLTDSLHLQVQHNKQMEQRFAALQSSLSQRTTVQTERQTTEYGNRNYEPGCFYCRGTHRILDCEHVHLHLNSGWIRKIENQLRLPDGSKIPRDGAKTMKEVIESMGKPRPGIIPMAKIQNKSSLMQGTVPRTFPDLDVGELAEDQIQTLTTMVQKVGMDRLQNFVQSQEIINDDPEWNQNFD